MAKKSREYWLKRAELKLQKLDKEQDKIEKKLKKSYKDAIKEIKKEIAALYAEGTLTEFEQYRAEGTIRSLESLLDEMATNEEQILKEGLTELYKDTQKLEAASLEVSFQTVNDNAIREVMQTNWSGLTFSERIWDNRKKLASKVKETLNKGLIRGDSLQTMAQSLADVMNKDFNRAMVLVHTETCWVQSEASKRQYEEEGVTEYEFAAFLDNKTTKECRELDGKIFKIKDGVPGVNMPPMHPRCRSCIMPVVESLKGIESAKTEKHEELNAKPINKYGQEIQFNLEGFKDEAKDRIIKIITELSDKYNTSLVSVNKNQNAKEAGKVDAAMNMYLSSTKKVDIVHEFAHSLSTTNREKLKLSNDKEFWKEMKKLNKEYKKAIHQDRSKMISVYSTESVDEFLAEGFAHSYLKGEIKSDWFGENYEYSDKIMAIVNKYFLKH